MPFRVDYYDPQIIGVNFNMPIYSIKNTIYKTDYCRKYIKSFLILMYIFA